MKLRTIPVALAAAALSVGLVASPASADHTKGKKYRDFDLTRSAAIAANDPFGIAPAGTSGSGAMYLNAGKQRFCLFLDFELPADTRMVAMHLHEKDADGANPQVGPIVVDASSLLNDEGTASSGCVSADRSVLRGVLSEPGDYYVNAHTSDSLSVVRGNIGRN